MYKDENFQVVWIGLLILGPCLYWLVWFFVHHAAKSLINTQEVILCWKLKLVNKVERRQLKSLKPCGFDLGPFFKLKESTVLDIMNTILNYTATVLLSKWVSVPKK